MIKNQQPSLKDVTVVIPAFNESEWIGACLEELQAKCPGLNILVVDDGSSDDTFKIAAQFNGVKVIRHQSNRGYGAALKTGMIHASTSVVAWYDSDGQHRPEDLVRVVAPVLERQLDASIGAREKTSSKIKNRWAGKKLLLLISQLIARQRIPDLNCGLRAFRTSVIRCYLHLLPNGYSASTTTTLLMIKRGHSVGFCPVHVLAGTGHSKVRFFRDGVRSLKTICRVMVIFDGFLFFMVLSAFQIVPGFIYSIYVALAERSGVPVLGAIAVLSGMLTLGLGFISSQINEIRQESFEMVPLLLETRKYNPAHAIIDGDRFTQQPQQA